MVKSKKQHAGRFIFAGASGCAFRNPPLKCKGEATRRNSKYVSKLMNKYSALDEFEEARPFQFNTHKQYFIWPESQCEIDRTNIQPSNELNKCTAEAGYRTLLFSENGGDNLWDLQLHAEEYIPFFESLVNLFDGLEAIRHRVYFKSYSGYDVSTIVAHCDIKPLNIVTLKQPDGTFRTRFIDFGLAMTMSELYPQIPVSSGLPELMATFKSLYFAWPFEVALYSTTFGDPSKSQDENLMNHIEKWYSMYDMVSISIMPENAYYSGSCKNNANRRITLDVARSLVPTAQVPMKDILQPLDMYSMGISLAYIYKRFARQQQMYIPDGSLGISNVDTTNPWQVEVAETITKPISQLIIDMTAIRPEDRIKPLEVKARYEAILPAMRKLFTPELLNTHLYSTKLPLGFIEPPLSPTNLGAIQITPPKVNVPLPLPPSPVRAAAAPLVAENLLPASGNAKPQLKKKKWTIKRNNSGAIIRKPKWVLKRNNSGAVVSKPVPTAKPKWTLKKRNNK